MYVAILGRNPNLSIAELEAVYGADKVKPLNHLACQIEAEAIDIDKLGGTVRVGELLQNVQLKDWDQVIQGIKAMVTYKHNKHGGKITLGVSFVGDDKFNLNQLKLQLTKLKKAVNEQDISLRLVPNKSVQLNIAQFRSNKLDRRDKKFEVMVIQNNKGYLLAESIAAPDIDAFTYRDRHKPFRDTKMGMLPPQLAKILVSLSSHSNTAHGHLLDPFCGSGTILMEARMHGIATVGSDLNPKMVKGTTKNLQWLDTVYGIEDRPYSVEAGNAINCQWPRPVRSVASETYLGPPLSQPIKLEEFQSTIKEIDQLHRDFLHNLATQIEAEGTVALAIPAWKAANQPDLVRLPLVDDLEALGYNHVEFTNLRGDQPLIYQRDNQFVAREILVLKRK